MYAHYNYGTDILKSYILLSETMSLTAPQIIKIKLVSGHGEKNTGFSGAQSTDFINVNQFIHNNQFMEVTLYLF